MTGLEQTGLEMFCVAMVFRKIESYPTVIFRQGLNSVVPVIAAFGLDPKTNERLAV